MSANESSTLRNIKIILTRRLRDVKRLSPDTVAGIIQKGLEVTPGLQQIPEKTAKQPIENQLIYLCLFMIYLKLIIKHEFKLKDL